MDFSFTLEHEMIHQVVREFVCQSANQLHESQIASTRSGVLADAIHLRLTFQPFLWVAGQIAVASLTAVLRPEPPNAVATHFRA